MEQVTNQNFYHIQKINPANSINKFTIGNEYIIGDKYNPFFDYFYHFGYPNVIENYNQIKQLVSDYQLFAREILFEEVRKEFYPNKPSRQKCLWLIPNSPKLKESLNFWLKEIISHNENTSFEILKLSCTGNVFLANSHLLPKYFGHFTKYKEEAHKYWNGEHLSIDSIFLEALFIGKIKVLDAFSSINDVKI